MFNKKQVRDLAKQPGFDKDALRELLEEGSPPVETCSGVIGVWVQGTASSRWTVPPRALTVVSSSGAASLLEAIFAFSSARLLGSGVSISPQLRGNSE